MIWKQYNIISIIINQWINVWNKNKFVKLHNILIWNILFIMMYRKYIKIGSEVNH